MFSKQRRLSLLRIGLQFQVKFGRSDGDDAQKPINRYEVTVVQNLGRMTNAVDARDTEFPCNDRAVNQHSAAAFDDGNGEWYQVCHRRLNCVTHQDFTFAEIAEIIAAPNTAHQTCNNAR